MKRLQLLLASLWSVAVLGQAPSVVQPAISPDGNTIAFSYQGDIWTMPFTGGEAKRLTIHEAYDGSPVWSPDGKSIAFSSDRYGNNDIFTMPATGGFPTRLTFHSANDNLSDWTADGKILFTTNRVYNTIEWDSEIHQVAASGGTPSRMLNSFGNMPAQSPNGNWVAIVRGSCRLAREAYRGPANKDLWLYNTKTDSYSQLTTDEGNDYLPLWVNDQTLYFISAKSGRYNIYQQALGTDGKAAGEAVAKTSYSDYGVSTFDVASNGNVVFERMGSLYTISGSGKPQKLSINLGADYRFDPYEHKTFSGDLEDYAISPNGKLAALSIHGEIFVMQNDKEKSRTVNISNHAYRDQEPVWLNDSTLLFISDREGQYDMYLARSTDKEQTDLFKTLKREVVRLTKTSVPESNLVLSPNGKKLAYMKGKGKFVVAEIDENGKLSNEVVLLEGWGNPGGVSWSPDSRWLAYANEDLDFNSEVFIHAADNSQKPVNVSMHPRGDGSPVWSPDGKKLGFLSDRNNGDSDVWFAWLTEADWEKTKRDWEEDEPEEKKDKKKKDDKDDKDKKDDDVEPIKIDLANIHERLQQVTSMPGSEGSLAMDPKSEFFYFTTQSNTKDGRDLFKAKWDGSETKEITSDGGSPYRLSLAANKKMYFIKKGRFNQLDPGSDKIDGIGFSAKMQIERKKEMEQMFEEAWATLNDWFYDPNFHGQDFNKLKKDFKEITLNASNKRDFRYFYNQMLGQLNASHMGLYGRDEAETQTERTGLLGVEVEQQKKGVKITRIVPDSPADREQSKLAVGETILSVNGQPVTDEMNYYSLFTNTADEKMLLEVQGSNGTREVVIRPTNSLRDELYNEWVDAKRALTEKYSGGRLGYLHIEGMNWPSFERFERELTAAGYGKDGIVIDVRYNGGGYTTDYLMAVLNVKQHAYTVPRGAAASLEKENKKFSQNYPYGERLPFAAWTKPAIAMCNASSYSNAEIFSHAFKTLGRGKLVGIPTFGAVISTGGQRLIDGSLIRMPFRAWYVKATGENMELGPAVPNFVIDNSPDSRAKGVDEQLKKSVDELLKEVR